MSAWSSVAVWRIMAVKFINSFQEVTKPGALVDCRLGELAVPIGAIGRTLRRAATGTMKPADLPTCQRRRPAWLA